MACKDLVARVYFRANRLGHAKDHAPCEGAPQVAKATYDDRFKAKDQAASAGCPQ